MDSDEDDHDNDKTIDIYIIGNELESSLVQILVGYSKTRRVNVGTANFRRIRIL
jgi:hypothetical protein